MESKSTSPWVAKPQDLSIIWSDNNRYWQIDEDEAKLLQVCWFDVSYTFDDVAPGQYSVVIRGKNITTRTFDFKVEAQDESNTLIKEEINSEQVIEDGFSCCTFTLEKPGKCTVLLNNHSRLWKCGLIINSLTLQPTTPARFLKTKSAANNKH